MFDISVRTAILQHCFWCSLFHCSWFRGGSEGPADPDRNQLLHHHLQVCAEVVCTHSNLWQLYIIMAILFWVFLSKRTLARNLMMRTHRQNLQLKDGFKLHVPKGSLATSRNTAEYASQFVWSVSDASWLWAIQCSLLGVQPPQAQQALTVEIQHCAVLSMQW